MALSSLISIASSKSMVFSSPCSSLIKLQAAAAGITPILHYNTKASTCRSSLSYNEQEIQKYLGPVTMPSEDVSRMRHKEVMMKVRRILSRNDDPLESAVTIDSLQRLAIDHHFQDEIQLILCSIYEKFHKSNGDSDASLLHVSLLFRLFRQARYQISPDVFHMFMDGKGKFKPSLSTDLRGLLSLYEASQTSMEEGDESILCQANEFSSSHLQTFLGFLEPNHARLVRQTLEDPIHMSLKRGTADHYLKFYPQALERNEAIQDLAVLDYDIVQSLHKRELREISGWWKDLGLAQELSFARNQVMKWYMWPTAALPDPSFSKYRVELTKVIAFVYMMDDIFDVYGSLDELSLLTQAVNKWSPDAMDSLPGYMRAYYKALCNITNEIASLVLKEHGWNPIEYLKKSWMSLSNAFIVEAKWFRSGCVPNSEDYLKNGVISSGVPLILTHVYLLLGGGLTKQTMDMLERETSIISYPATILRLWDDLGSAKDDDQDGFDGSYLEYYKKEHPGCSAEDAKDQAMHLISNAWRSLNKECLSPSSFSPSFTTACLNSARMVKVMYSYDADQGLPLLEDYMRSLLC